MAPRKPRRAVQSPGEALRASLTAVYEFGAAELAVLDLAAHQADHLAALEAVVAEEGPTSVGSAGQRIVHPAIVEARQARLALSRLLAQLDLPDEDGGQAVPSAATLRARKAARARWGTQEAG